MKLMITILPDKDSEPVTNALVSSGFRVTRISSTGGFLHRGSTTLMIGVANEKVDEAIRLIRSQVASTAETAEGKAVVFVLNVEDFQQL